MPNQVAILHGWSDTSASFRPLAEFLEASGYEAVPLWLGDYVSMDDDVKVEDIAKRMETVVNKMIAAGALSIPFDLIAHSTGGLVARHWIAEYYVEKGRACPVKRLVMLAPANFGSRLAVIGKSMLVHRLIRKVQVAGRSWRGLFRRIWSRRKALGHGCVARRSG